MGTHCLGERLYRTKFKFLSGNFRSFQLEFQQISCNLHVSTCDLLLWAASWGSRQSKTS